MIGLPITKDYPLLESILHNQNENQDCPHSLGNYTCWCSVQNRQHAGHNFSTQSALILLSPIIFLFLPHFLLRKTTLSPFPGREITKVMRSRDTGETKCACAYKMVIYVCSCCVNICYFPVSNGRVRTAV